MARLRKDLSVSGMLSDVKRIFDKIPDAILHRSNIKLSDCLMSALAVFSLKYPSLLQFEKDQNDSVIAENLQNLYGINQVPSDTYMRERLDDVDPDFIKKTFKKIFSSCQRGKELEKFGFMSGHYLMSIDGTGFFSSSEVHCKHCCKKHHRNGKITYYHQVLGAALVHPDHSHVLPIAPEPIKKQDGTSKNDCERNAAKRLLQDIRNDHPHLKLIVIEDSLSSNGPHIKLLQKLGMKFILGAKKSDHTFLFDWVEHSKYHEHQKTDKDGGVHRYRYINNVPLNDTHFDLEVNFLEYWYTSPKGKKLHFSWVTDIKLDKHNVYQIMKGGRARWRIENETFNTLKNQGYHFEHNFGHGHNHLSTVMAHLMMLAFLIDQVQGLSCKLFQQALSKAEKKKYFWEKIRGYFISFVILSWEDLFNAIALKPRIMLVPDTS